MLANLPLKLTGMLTELWYIGLKKKNKLPAFYNLKINKKANRKKNIYNFCTSFISNENKDGYIKAYKF